MRLSLGCLAVFLLLTPAASRQLTAVRVSASDDLQAAIDAARPGDTILLAAGARFTGNFVLRTHSATPSYVTIRTEGDGLPGPGVRTGPEHARRLAWLQSPNNEPALRTAPGAHHWRLENLGFGPNAGGYGNIIALGDGSANQRTLADVPHTLVLDRLYVHGDPALGQRRGIALNSAATEIRNCYIADIKGVGMDTQAIGGWNGPGPFLIENNYLEGAGENVMFGGGDPAIRGLVPQGIEFRRNLLRKPVSWREPLVTAPAGLRASARPGGTLAPGDYAYRVSAERPAGQGVTAVSEPSERVSVRIEGGGSAVALEWAPVPAASAYRVYRRTADQKKEVSWRAESPRFIDSGKDGEAGSPPSRPPTWEVKNLFELKNAREVVVDGNVFEYNWVSGQVGYAIVLTPRNQDGGSPWSVVEDVTFSNNVVRHVAGGINILGTDNNHPSERTRRIHIVNNLFYDVGTPWGTVGDFLQVGAGPEEVVVEDNTVVHAGRVIAAHGASHPATEFVFRNNLARHNRYGVIGSDAGIGASTLERYFPNVVFEGNVLAGGKASQYPRGNHFPSEDELESAFVNPSRGDYRVKPGHPLHGRGADIEAIEAALGARTTAPASPGARPQSRD